MARFRFNLENVLDLRRRTERDAQVVFAEINRERLGLEATLRRYQGTMVGFKRDLRGALTGDARGGGVSDGARDGVGGRVTLHDVRLQAGASLTMMGKAQSAVLELAGVHKRLDSARAVLLDAARARKAVEMLRDRRFEAWKREQAKREALELDDMSTMRAGRDDLLTG